MDRGDRRITTRNPTQGALEASCALLHLFVDLLGGTISAGSPGGAEQELETRRWQLVQLFVPGLVHYSELPCGMGRRSRSVTALGDATSRYSVLFVVVGALAVFVGMVPSFER